MPNSTNASYTDFNDNDLDDEVLEQPRPKVRLDYRAPKSVVYAGFYFGLGFVLLLFVAWLVLQVGWALLDVCTPFIVGTLIALLIDPIVVWCERHGLSRLAAILAVFGLLVVLLSALAAYTIPALITEANNLGATAPAVIDGFLKTHHKIGPVALPKNFNSLVTQLAGSVSAAASGSSQALQDFVIGSATTVVETVVTFIIAFYILVDVDRIRARIYYLTPSSNRSGLRQYTGEISKVFSQYVRGLVTVCSFYSLATIVLLYAMSLVHPALAQYALLIGIVAGILYSVPYLGAITTALVTFIVAFATGGIGFAIVAVGLTLVVNQIFDNVVTPKVVGGGVGLHPVIALLALALGGELFKIGGLLLAVPIAGCIQVILYRIYPKLRTPTPKRFMTASLAEAQEAVTEKPGTDGANPEAADTQ